MERISKAASDKIRKISNKKNPSPFLDVKCDVCGFTIHLKEYLNLHQTILFEKNSKEYLTKQKIG